MTDVIAARKKFSETRKEFYEIFGVPLNKYWDIYTPAGMLCGFDITRFDDEVIKSDKESMRDTVLAKYGERGVQLIHKLIH